MKVVVEDVDAVRIVTINRPEARNALDGDVISALFGALCDADDDDGVRAVVLTGTDPAFCAGNDLKQIVAEGDAYFQRHRREPVIRQPGRMSTPILGAVNGACFTGGLELALGCDFLIASDRARFADTHARVGVRPRGGMTARLPGVVGAAWARRISFTGEIIDAGIARRIGLVTEVVPHDELMGRAVELAMAIAAGEASVVHDVKRMYVEGTGVLASAALEVEETIADAGRVDLSAMEQRRQAVLDWSRSRE